MNYELILVRYGEIALKGKETRRRFESTLVSNINNAHKAENISKKIKKEWGRIYIYTKEIEKSISVLKKIFGIYSVSPAIKTSSDLDSIVKISLDISKSVLNKNKSFAIRATRIGTHEYTSQDVAIKTGEAIVKATNASVDLTKPDFELFIEVRNDKSFLFTEKIRGVGGMPLGTQGNVLAIIDSKKSILAAWYLLKRGCKVIFLNQNSNRDILKSFTDKWYIKSKIIDVDSNIYNFEEIKHIAYENKCEAIVTGHTVFDTTNNVLSEIKQIKNQSDLPVLHPLIALNEDQIIKKSKQIGLS